MITEGALLKAVGKLMSMPYYPVSETLVKISLIDELPEIAGNDEQLAWLIRRVTSLYAYWPGLSEIRAVYCSKFKPRDGIEVHSGVFLDGVPSESKARNREIDSGLNKPRRQVTEGLVTRDLEFLKQIESAGAHKLLRPVGKQMPPGRSRR